MTDDENRFCGLMIKVGAVAVVGFLIAAAILAFN